ncbi:hypothetical protein GCM10023347_11170 [Streptomyces chumphonensis]
MGVTDPCDAIIRVPPVSRRYVLSVVRTLPPPRAPQPARERFRLPREPTFVTPKGTSSLCPRADGVRADRGTGVDLVLLSGWKG